MDHAGGGSGGRLVDASRLTVVVAWVFAGVWNAIAWTAVAVMAGDVRDWRLALVALFPLVGLGLVAWAVRATLRHLRFGTSVLELRTMPAVAGRGLEGTVLVPAGVSPSTRFDVVLRRIVRTTSGSGKSRSTRESIAWEERAAPPARTDGRSVQVPVAFRIPAGEAPTGAGERSRSRVLWRLEVSADVPGVDYHASFEVPVVAPAPGEAVPAGAEDGTLPPVPDPADFRQPPDSPIRVATNRRGTEIVYPAARNPGVAAGLTAFLLVWCGMTIGISAAGAPTLFPVLFGGFAVLMLVGVLRLWLGVTRVVVDRGTVSVTSGLLGGGRSRTLTAAEVAAVDVGIGMQAGDTPYYSVRIVRTNGRRITAGSGIRDKREAEWLAHTIRGGLAG